jgi:hypothetical protein
MNSLVASFAKYRPQRIAFHGSYKRQELINIVSTRSNATVSDRNEDPNSPIGPMELIIHLTMHLLWPF